MMLDAASVVPEMGGFQPTHRRSWLSHLRLFFCKDQLTQASVDHSENNSWAVQLFTTK